ncbi:hypothetical protein [Hydrogenophaga palleronii]|uniref:hypothetical protein n=1 Tax=Hydrogenophaga palleronii TaxID=65655 RepID=UPI0012EE544C|nr:hypothetical protein [Hydrogenophaga palleronii]
MAPGDDLSNQCLTADVYYGDSQIPAGAVRSTPQKTAPDAEASVRIQSSIAINEPIVTLYVKAGCGRPFTRRFVLLADPLNEPMAAAPASAAPSPATVRAAEAPGAGEGAAAARSNNRPAASASSAAAPARTAAASATRAPAARPPSVVRRAAPAAAAPAAPRLTLDPIDLDPGIERNPVLKLSPSLLSEPGSSTEETRAAAGLLWKAINATPEDVLHDAQRLAALEAEAAQLRAAQGQSTTSINELNSQLEQARDQRYRNWLVYLLGGLLLLALLALLVLSRRRAAAADGTQASRAWWSADPADKAVAEQIPRNVPQEPRRKVPAPVVAPVEQDTQEIDLDLGHHSALDSLSPLVTEELQARDRRDFSASALGVSRSVATEELFDVQQQADFFVSLGEDEQAIQVLRNHLAESHEPSPLAYLDLFKLYHRLGRRKDYDALRDEFNHVFNAGAPPFSQYEDVGRGLEAYETAFSRIQSLWPQPRVLDLIEESIFRDANDDPVEVFDLEAYRELLLLHAIAKDLVKRDDPPAARASGFGATRMQPLKAEGRLSAAAETARAVADDATIARNTQPMGLDLHFPVSSRIGLDVNLDDLSAFSAFEASLPEVSPPVEPSAQAPQGPRSPVSNMIDFEVLDFSPPEDLDGKDGGKR